MNVALEQLISDLIKDEALRTPEIIDAFRSVDRKMFVLPEHQLEAYGDYPLPIGYGQTISQPTTVAMMLEWLRPEAGQKILDVGSGSGWTTALLARIVGTKGKAIGVEIIPELVSFGQKNLAKFNFPQAKIIQAGKILGHSPEAPYDRILVSAASQKLPQELVDQLAIGGTMIIPIGNSIFRIRKKSETNISREEFPGFVFVPLVALQ